jgi:hypothetical protein
MGDKTIWDGPQAPDFSRPKAPLQVAVGKTYQLRGVKGVVTIDARSDATCDKTIYYGVTPDKRRMGWRHDGLCDFGRTSQWDLVAEVPAVAEAGRLTVEVGHTYRDEEGRDIEIVAKEGDLFQGKHRGVAWANYTDYGMARTAGYGKFSWPSLVKDVTPAPEPRKSPVTKEQALNALSALQCWAEAAPNYELAKIQAEIVNRFILEAK